MPIHIQVLTRQFTALICSLLLVPGGPHSVAEAQEPQQAAAAEAPAPKIPNDQLDSLVAPIALYPDPLLAQVLAASTYPLEIVQLQQWLTKNKDLKDKALADAVQKQPWDASIQSMAALPDVVKRLADDIGWTTDLGNAVLAQQGDVMDAVQRMRAKAKEKGNLQSNEQMKVETKTVESKQVIVIEQSKPQVVYVPSYDPVVVYGAPPYPYPPIAYPPPGYYAGGLALSFGVGMMVGAAMGGGWCCNSGWGGGSNNNININNNNTYVNNSNKQNINNSGNRTGNSAGSGNSNWQHNSQHRGGAPYSNKATANKYGGTARGDSASSRQANARQNQGQRGGGQQAGSMDRGGRQQAGSMDRGGGGGDKVGNRSVSSGSSAGSKGGGFGGASGGSGRSAQASSSRGSSSMGGSRGGGSRGGGGGRRR